MSDGRTHKEGVFHVKHAMDGGARSPAQERTNFSSTRSSDHVTLPQPSPPLSPQVENTHRCLVAPMETVVGKHQGLSQQHCHAICPGAQAGSGVFENRLPSDFRLQSPTADLSSLYSSQASSRESVFSDGWDREKSWSAMQLSDVASPLSLSRAASPCSSVRSGMFTPTVLRVRRHTLATGSSLLHMPQASCLSSCESLASSVGAQSPPPPPTRHRPPLTRLSLLTAILRKGRLPVLSPALQRPYSPCWPINHITLASCTACSAASSLPPVFPLCPRSPRTARSPLSPADTPATQSPSRWDSFRCRPALPTVHIKDSYGGGPRATEISGWDRSYHAGKEPKFQTVFSRPVKGPIAHRATGGGSGITPAQVPLLPPQSPTSQLRAASADLAKPQEGTASTSLHRSIPWWCSRPSSPRENCGAQTDPRSLDDNSQQIAQTKLKHSSPEAGNILARRVCSPPPLPATARLDCVSPQPRSCLKNTQAFAAYSHSHSPSPSPSHSHSHSPSPSPSHSHSHSATVSEPQKLCVSKFPVLGNTPVPGPSSGSAGHKVSPAPGSSCLLSPSRYTPIAFPGWPSPNSSRTSTPDRFTLSPSPASQAHDLTPCPSPSPSLRSTPSPRPGSGRSECTYREGKEKKPHKIKSSYKSLAAIPTNTLLLDQQVIDKQVEEVDDPCGISEDPHAEMCSPAQLRQESEELYATIDKILEDSIPKQTQHNSFGRSVGRETKYSENRTLDRNKDNGGLDPESQAVNKGESFEDAGTPSTSALFITEPSDGCPHSVKQGASTTFRCAAEVLPEVSETHI
ncbi:hypothetical protein NHX12_022042 [Muraenolepis orangiensis]|uniref:Muscular LMNA-interacting protein n=1 Tax=Muraenolepis orangiensis TaxID=630683 RepID=A0A9Q0EQU7_9TELE|nr:hypothetical protein NHX12_022042 [Muraenolepis orangiensis]